MKCIIKHKNLIISIIVPFIWIFLISITCGIYFETNDDRLFSEIFSGAMTGTPEFRSYYIHPLLGLIITFFYRITTAVPWYGLLLILFQWICHAVFTFAVLNYYESPKNKFVASVWTISYYAICFTFIAHIQFTSTAALLAITGYLYLFLTNSSLTQPTQMHARDISLPTHSLQIFFVLQLLSYFLRSDSMLMIQPYGVAMLAALSLCAWIKTHSCFFIKYFCKVLLGILLIIFLGKATHYLFHHDSGWKEYEKINQGVTEITDYSHIPEYEDVQSILKKYDVTEKQYLAFFQYAMIEPNLSGDCLLEVAEYARNTYHTPSLSQVVSELMTSFTNSEYFGIGKLAIFIWIFALLYAILSRSFPVLLTLIFLAGSRTFIWSYLLYRGRTPFRVIFPLWVIELLFIMVILFTLPTKRSKITSILQICILYISLFGSVVIFTNQYTTIKPQNVSDSLYNSGYIDLIEYCDKNSSNRYFLDAGILLYYRGNAYTAKPFHPRNSLITGCWYSGAPVLYKRIAEYAPPDTDIHLIVSPDLPIQKEAVLNYFEEWRNTTAIYEESFTVSNGGIYEVYGLYSSNIP